MSGQKMAKSTGNIIRVVDLVEAGHDPLAFRFLCLGAKYRAKLSFSMDVLEGAERGLNSIRQRASRLAAAVVVASPGGLDLQRRFAEAVADDLDLPIVSALLQEVLRAEIPDGEKRGLLERGASENPQINAAAQISGGRVWESNPPDLTE